MDIISLTIKILKDFDIFLEFLKSKRQERDFMIDKIFTKLKDEYPNQRMIRPLDFVITKKLNIGIVNEVSGFRNKLSITFLDKVNNKDDYVAWHPQEEVILLESLQHLLARMTCHSLSHSCIPDNF
ncbi:MAG: hypothetical protein LIP09_08735 [Bacteroidales bacterium]|nr:hypothetical protein [Bacteroidales bacterium]